MASFPISDLLGLSEPIDIVDVGAAPIDARPEIYQPLLDQGIGRVTGFEPDAVACDKFNAMHQGNDNRCLPYFVGNGGAGTFHNLRLPECSSLLAPNRVVLDQFRGFGENFDVLSTEQVQTTRLDEVQDLGNVDFLKIDAQGGELDVLHGSRRILDNVLVVYCEVEFLEMYVGQPLFGDVDSMLRESGFSFHAFENMAKRAFLPMIVLNKPQKGLRQTIWADAWFIRNPLGYADLSTSKLAKIALLAHELLGSYDVTLKIMEIIDKRRGTKICAEYLARF